MAKDLLFEIGAEEIPAGFMPNILGQLKQLAETKLNDAHLPFESIATYGTPRRLALIVKGLADTSAEISSVDCDTAFAFFWSFIDHAVILEVSLTFFSQYFSDCSSQSSFTMVNVTDCTDVNMRFRTFKFFFCHFKLSSEENSNSINLI